MTNIDIKINAEYREHLDLLKQVIPNKEGKQITDDNEMVETLVDEFIAFVQQHAAQEQGHDPKAGGCGS